MNMTLEMKQTVVLKQTMLCPLCENEWSNHSKYCLYKKLEEVLKLDVHAKCPSCKNNTIGLNDEDFFECRKCRSVYTSSSVYEEKKSKLFVISFFRDGQEYTYPVIFKHKKIGKNVVSIFPVDETVFQIRSEIDKQLADKKKAKINTKDLVITLGHSDPTTFWKGI